VATMILYWDGTAWKRQKTPAVGTVNNQLGENKLLGVAATSRTNAWAVGFFAKGITERTLSLHWNGTVWKRQPTLNIRAARNYLIGVGASSATNAWSVGHYSDGTMTRTLALHCC